MLTANQVLKINRELCTPIFKAHFLKMADDYRYMASVTCDINEKKRFIGIAEAYESLATKC